MPTRYLSVNSFGEEEGWLWLQIKVEACYDAKLESALASYLYPMILSYSSLERSLSFHLGNKLRSSTLLLTLFCDLFLKVFSFDPSLRSAVVANLCATREPDPTRVLYSHCVAKAKATALTVVLALLVATGKGSCW
ncbi:Serine acetyltransferase 5 [Spatholobus suberectus]|nr:Serine acetyltransferase 5 [Spatholobus suberectus]